MKFINMFVFLLLATCATAFGQDAAPSPAASGVAIDVATNAIASVLAWAEGHWGIMTSVLGFVWMLVVKLVSTESTGKIVTIMQAWTDGIARLLMGLGALVQKLSELLAAMVRSDGILGRK